MEDKTGVQTGFAHEKWSDNHERREVRREERGRNVREGRRCERSARIRQGDGQGPCRPQLRPSHPTIPFFRYLIISLLNGSLCPKMDKDRDSFACV